MIRSVQLGFVAIAGVFLLSACGDTSLSDSVHVFIDPEEGTAGIDVAMSDGMQVNLDGEFVIGGNGYGVISFIQPTRHENGKIRIAVDLQAMADDHVGDYAPVTALPNGAPLPAAMLPPLFKVPVIDGSTSVDAVVSLVPELQLGALIHMSAFNSSRFPAGVAVCQNFRNSENMAYAAVCVFGPGNNKSGGVFVGGTLGEVLDLDFLEQQQEQSQLRASRSSAMMAASLSSEVSEISTLKTLVSVREEARSSTWDEQRYDPRRQLSGSKGRKALNNAKAILKRR